jgi:periplasmic divalent cation tolerance protein
MDGSFTTDLLAVFTTTASREDARRIASALVQRGLVACAQLSDVESLYRWKGAIQQDTECRLMLKTTAARYAQVEAALRELHPYALPAVFAVPVTQAFEPYAAWVREETA